MKMHFFCSICPRSVYALQANEVSITLALFYFRLKIAKAFFSFYFGAEEQDVRLSFYDHFSRPRRTGNKEEGDRDKEINKRKRDKEGERRGRI